MDNSLLERSVVSRVERPGQRFVFHYGEGFRYERLPVGTRVLYPPPPVPPIQDVDSAIEQALDQPADGAGLSQRLRPGMRVTIAFDDLSLPLPPMQRPDVRGRVIEKVLARLRARGVEDVHVVAALGLHRRMTPAELRHAVGRRVFHDLSPERLYNHDAEDRENMVVLGNGAAGEEVEVPRRIAQSDLLVYVNINLVAMDGGHKSINTGLVTYRSLRAHHNVDTLMRSRSYMDPPSSALHHACARMGDVVERNLNVFKVETTLNSNTFPSALRHLQLPEEEWSLLDRTTFQANRAALRALPFGLRRWVFHQMRAPYGVTSVQAGSTGAVHRLTMASVERQQMVPVHGQADVLVAGVPYLGPYNVNSVMNPILVHSLVLGYMFNLYRGMPLVREGGVLILTHPLESRFHPVHHPSYIDFFNRVLPQTRDPREIESEFEEEYATNPRYVDLYRRSYAYHGVHPFYMWYWACHGQAHLGRVIVVGARDPAVAARLGYSTAPSMDAALEMARDTAGRDPSITCFHWAPIFMCDVS